MAGNSVPISIKLNAIDGVTAKVAAINARLAKVTAPVSRLQTSFANLGKESGLSAIGESLGKVGSNGKEFFDNLFSGVAKAGLAIVAAGGALYKLTDSFAQAGNEIQNVSERLGISTDAFQELAFAFHMADISQEDFVASMQKLQKNMVEARMGTGDAMHAFNALGINLKTSSGRVKNAEEVLGEFADGIHGIKDAALKTKLVMTVFGKSGAPLLNLLSQGSAGIAKFRAEARRVGAVMDKDQIANASGFDDAMKSVGATLLMVRNIVGSAVAPELVKIGEALQSYILDHVDDIKSFAKQFAEGIPGALKMATDALASLWQAVQPVISIIKTLADTFGGLNLILGVLTAYIFGPAIASFVALAGSIISLGTSIGGLIIRLGGLVLGPIIAMFGTFFSAIFSGLPILGALNAVLIANPIGAIVTGVALLAAGFVFLYKNVKPVADLIDWTFDKLKSLAGITGTGDFFGHGTIKTKTPELPQGAFGAAMPQMASTQQSAFGIPGLGQPTIGPPVGAQAVQQDAAKGSVNKTENQVTVSFENLPRGTKVEQTKTEAPLDLFMGYASPVLN